MLAVQLGTNSFLQDDDSGAQRPVGSGQTATLRVGQHLHLTLSGGIKKRYTLNNTVASIMSRTQPADGSHKRVHAANQAGSAVTAANEDPFGWSMDHYPADKKARVRLADNGGGGSGSGSSKATPDGNQSDAFFTPPAPVDMRQYKQSTLSFSPLSGSTVSSSPSSELHFTPSLPAFHHLAFPCLALNVAAAHSLAVIRISFTAIAAFLATHTAPMLRLFLCENDDSAYLALKSSLDAADEFASQLASDSRFSLLHASVASLQHSAHSSQSVVNSTDWRWSSAGDKKRRAIDCACNEQLTRLTRASLPFGKTAGREGQVHCVPLTQPCPLTDAGVRQVIQVVTPELKGAASTEEDSTAGSPVEDEKQDATGKLSDEYSGKLTKAYQQLFDTWYSQLSLPKHHVRAAPQRSPRTAHSPRSDASSLRPSQSDALLPDNFSTSATPLPPYSTTRSAPPPSAGGGWHNALRVYLQHPRPMSVQSAVYCEDRSYLAIYDAYPKSRCHLLLLAKSHLPHLASVADCTADTLYLLHDMKQRSEHIVAAVMQQMQASSSRRLELWVGFHAIPSLQPLHCHILTSDLSTNHMKHKKVYRHSTLLAAKAVGTALAFPYSHSSHVCAALCVCRVPFSTTTRSPRLSLSGWTT